MFFCKTKLLFSQLSLPCFNMINLQCCVHTVSYGTGYGICPKISCTRACPTIDLNIFRCHASRCVRSQQRTKMVYKKCVGYFGCSMQTSQAIFAIDVIRATRCLTMTWDVRLPIVITMNIFFCGSNQHPSFLDSKSLLHHPMPDKQDDE